MKLKKSDIDKITYAKADNKKQIVWDDVVPGMGLRVYPSGKKSFVLNYRTKGRQTMKVLGQYGVITLDQARGMARKDLASLLDGKDPMEARARARGGKPFREFASEYMDRYAKQHKKSWVEDQRRLSKYLIPAFGTLAIDAIKRTDVAKLHGDIGKDYPYAANRVLEQASKMFELAKQWGYLDESATNPAQNIQAFKEQKRDRYVLPDEFPRLAEAINNEPNLYGRNALWLYLLTGLRRDELLSAKWSDIDWDREELRVPETKSGRVHYIPLTGPALSILRSLPQQSDNPYILPGERKGAHLVNIEKIWRRVRKAAAVEDVRLHDLRRTVGSWLAQRGNSLHLIGRVLNHKSQATTAVYARFAQDHVREALETHAIDMISLAKPEGVQLESGSNLSPRSKRKVGSR